MMLSGTRILSFTTGIAGPNAGRILASLGAEVIKVESMAGGIDAFRYFGSGNDLNSSARFAEANLGVRSVTVDLKHPDGLAIVRALVPHCDVVLENYRPNVLERLGLGDSILQELRPDIIVVKMPGLGSTGPMKSYGTWGALLNAYSGLTWLWNHADAERPVGNQGVFPDYLSSVLAPMVVVSALLHRSSTGDGAVIDLAQSEATAFCALPVSMLHVSVNGTDPAPIGNRSRGPELQGVYPCQGDDRWCAIRVEDDRQLRALLEIMSQDSMDDPRFIDLGAARQHHDEFDALIVAWTRGRSAEDVMGTLQGAGIPAGAVASGADLLVDAQLNRSGFIRRLQQPGIGEMVIPGLPVSVTPPLVSEPGPAPQLGADTQDVLKEILAMSDSDYGRLVEAGVLR